MSNNPQYYEDDFSLDIGKYIERLFRQWRLIAGVTFLFALAAAIFTLASPKSYQAWTLVASTRSASTVSFGTAIETYSEDQLAASGNYGFRLLDPETRMKSFVAMVKNPDIAEKVLAEFRNEINTAFKVDVEAGEEFTTAELLELVEGRVASGSDSIQITVTAPDPVLAADIANAWGAAYEKNINTLYGGTSETSASYSSIQRQTDETRAEYEVAQAALVEFQKSDQRDELARQINELQTTIDTLSTARNTAVQSVVNDLTATQLKIINSYFDYIASNQMLAIQRDREGRQQLLNSYISTLNQARQLVFNEDANNALTELTRKYNELRQADVLLVDAQDMREQVQQGGAGAALSNSLALTLLKAKIYATSQEAGQLIIQTQPNLLTEDLMLADLAALIQTLEDRKNTLETEIDDISQTLINGDGFTYLDAPLDPEGELAATIETRYAELWETGPLTDLATQIADGTTPIEQEAKARVDALLQLKGLEDQLNFNTKDSQQIQDLEAQVRELKAQLEVESDLYKELARARDLAWTTYSQLSTKEAELSVAAQTGGASVALAVPASVPDKDTVSGATNVIMASAVGFFLGIALAFAIEFWWGYKDLEPITITPMTLIRGDLRHMQPQKHIEPELTEKRPLEPPPTQISYPDDC